MLLPALNQARDRGKAIKCISQIKDLTSVNVLYADDYDGRMPSYGGKIGSTTCNYYVDYYWRLRYIKNATLFRCPSVQGHPYPDSDYKNPPSYFPNGSYAELTDYGYNSVLFGTSSSMWSRRLNIIKKPSQTILFADSIRAGRDYYTYGHSRLYQYYYTGTTGGHPSLRHLATANVGWVDGHVSAEKSQGIKDGGPYTSAINPYNRPGVFSGVNTISCHWAYYLIAKYSN
jgi:prepilin-type processing-associated H-X9-DG protein